MNQLRPLGHMEARMHVMQSLLQGTTQGCLAIQINGNLDCNVDYIDLYYLHRLAPGMSIEEVLPTFVELKQEGKIRSIGLCEVDAAVLEVAHEIHPISALQSEYSLWTRDIEQSVLPMCEQLNIPLVAFSPLGRGFLSGSITKEIMLSADVSDDFRKKLPRFNGDNFDKNCLLIEKLDKISQSVNINKSQLALSWLLHQSEIVNIIPGTRNDKYLLENFSAQTIKLDKSLLADLSEIFDPNDVYGTRYPSAINPGAR